MRLGPLMVLLNNAKWNIFYFPKLWSYVWSVTHYKMGVLPVTQEVGAGPHEEASSNRQKNHIPLYMINVWHSHVTAAASSSAWIKHWHLLFNKMYVGRMKWWEENHNAKLLQMVFYLFSKLNEWRWLQLSQPQARVDEFVLKPRNGTYVSKAHR
jgi:hypothetical protein